MRTRPPSSLIRSLFALRNLRSCSVDWTRKSDRSRAASPAISPSRSLRLESIADRLPSSGCGAAVRRIVIGLPWSTVVLEIGPHPLSKEHRVVSLEDPFAGPVAEGAQALVGLELVQCRVVREIEQDHVVEIPAVGDVVPAEEPDPVLRLVLTHLAGEQGPHVELEERVPAATDGEVGRQNGHGPALLQSVDRGAGSVRLRPAGTGAAYCRTGPSSEGGGSS